MVLELRQLKSYFGMELAASVEYRIEERRLEKLSTLQAYLENPHFFDPELAAERLLPYASKNVMTNQIRDIVMRLFNEEDEKDEETEQIPTGGTKESEQIVSPLPPKRKKSQELRDFKESRKNKTVSPGSSVTTSAKALTAIKNDMKTFELKGKRPEMLDQVSIVAK